MKKGIGSIGLVYMLVTAGFLGFITFGPEVGRAQTTIFVGSGAVGNDTNSIQDAVDNYANPGDTVFVHSGIYYENISVYKTINLTGEDKDTTIIDGMGHTYTVRVTANWVNITGFTIFNGTLGIQLDSSSNKIVNNNLSNNVYGIRLYQSTNDNEVTGNNVSNNDFGIYLLESSLNNITKNNVTTNNYDGIYLQQSSSNNLTNNNISNNRDGIYLFESINNNISGNNLSSNNGLGINIQFSSIIDITDNRFVNDGILITGDQLSHYNSHSISTSNFINGNPIYYYKDTNGIIIDGTAVGQIIIANCSNTVLKNLQINETDVGLEVAYSYNINVTGNEVSTYAYGIYLRSLLNSNITDNNLSYCEYSVDIASSWYNTIKGNKIWNGTRGIQLIGSSNNTMEDNDIWNNTDGIVLESSLDNTIRKNDIWNNFEGIYIWMGNNNNAIYHNNLINNTVQAYDEDNDIWNLTYPFGGNYWSDWTSPDTDGDGFVDSPYMISGGSNQDNWPFSTQDGWIYEWANKSSYPNHAPSGMPDFNQTQNTNWMAIYPGPNTILDTPVHPNDISDGVNYIAPGLDNILDSLPLVNDDIAEYAYCGPTAAANCLWWFDSKYANQTGIPGDGADEYPLVENYSGIVDDHFEDNVAPLIEDLANRFNTSMVGETNSSGMVAGIKQLLIDKGLDLHYKVYNVSWPTFNFTAQAIINCSDVILFLALYNDIGQRVWGHIVTSAGINKGIKKIAISDPILDIANPSANPWSHNDTALVSHDIYNVTIGPPFVVPAPAWAWQLDGYTLGYNISHDYAVVEGAVIIEPYSPPGAPIGLTASVGGTYINLSWNQPTSDGGSPITNYTIYRGTISDGEVFYKQVGNVLSFNDTDVTLGITCYYKVKAVNALGEGPFSNETNGTPSSPYSIDYINITDSPNGSELSGGDIPVGYQEWGYCSAYNKSEGYLGRIMANWSADGGNSILLETTPAIMNGIDVGPIGGDVWLNVTYAGLNASVHYNVLAPTIDYIEITDTIGGAPLSDKTVNVGYQEWGYCSAYNLTIGFISPVMVNWTIEGGDAFLLNMTTTEHNGVDVGTNGVDVWLNASYGVHTDSVHYDVIPPTIDYIEITDTPEGSPLLGGSVPIGFIEYANCTAYNNSIGSFGIVQANWTAEGGNSSLIGPIPSYNITIDVGNATGDVWLNASYLTYNASILYNVIPGIDYIDITAITDGSSIADASVPVGFVIWANCSAYNNTFGYLSTVSAIWTAHGAEGAVPSLGPTPAVSSWVNVGTNQGTVWFNASFGGLIDSVKLTVTPPTLDYIDITDTPDGASITGGPVPVGFMEETNCSAYNNTVGFIFTVNVNWSAEGVGGAAPFQGPTPAVSSWVSVGVDEGAVWWNASYFDGLAWFNDSVTYTVLPPTGDYIEITYTPGGTPLPGAAVLIDYMEWANCSVYNNTVGFIGTVAANWTAEGGNASLLAATPSVMNGINVGNITGTVWLNASYDIHSFSVEYTVEGITIDYIAITDIPYGTNLMGGMVPVGFSVWGNCSAYNLSLGYVDVVDAIWSAEGGTATLLGPTTPSAMNGIDVGTTAGIIWFNATYDSLSDSIQYILSQPTKPKDLLIISGESFINITWVAPDSNGSAPITGYTIYRGNTSGNELFLATLGVVHYFEDTTVINGETYYYNITASNSLGEGTTSVEVSATAGAVPSQPLNLSAEAGDSIITLTWSAPATDGGLPITNYRIYKGTASGSEVFEVEVGTVLTYDDAIVTNGITYYYQVRAVNALGEGALSNEANDTPLGPPSAPHSLTAETGDAYVHITWSAPTLDGGSAITNYRVYRGPDPDNLTFLIQVDNVLEYNDTGLLNNETYFYAISAVNGVGEGPQSSDVNGTPKAQVVPVNELPKVVITKPEDGAKVFGLIEVAGTSSDSDGTVESVQIRIDDRIWIDAEGTTSWSYQIDTENLTNGPHTIRVRSYDGENYSKEASITVEVDNPAKPKEKSVFEEVWFWAFIILVIIILLILFFMVFGKKIRERPEKEFYEEEEEEEEEPEEEWEEEEEPEEEPEGDEESEEEPEEEPEE